MRTHTVVSLAFLLLLCGQISHSWAFAPLKRIAERDDWDEIASAGLQMTHSLVWEKLRFHAFLDFLFPEIIANYTTPSADEKRVVFPSGEWLHLRLVTIDEVRTFVTFEVSDMSASALVPYFIPTSLVFFIQVGPWIDKNKHMSIVRTGFKMTGTASDVSLLVQARKRLTALLRAAHDTARSSVGAYPCSDEFRTFGGTCNNPSHPEWGSYEKALIRMDDGRFDPSFIPGTNSFPTEKMPNPRTVSRSLFQQHSPKPSSRKLTALAVFWGQFVDHDVGLTPSSENTVFEESMDIHIVDPRDPLYSRHNGKMNFTRSRGVLDGKPCCGHGVYERFPREPINSQSSFIDASQVYGCHRDRVDSLRSYRHGQLQIGSGSVNGKDFLPRNSVSEVGVELENAGSTSQDHFVAGDVRANEQPVLTSLHTLFMREHNRLAEFFTQRFPCWTEEKIFQNSRKVVAAQIQLLTYKFFIPAILGNVHALRPYRGYQSNVDPSISNFFSTCAFRFGHSMVPDTLTILGTKGRTHPKNGVSLKDVFFHPAFIRDVGIEPILLGSSHQIAETVDTQIVESLQNDLFKGLTGGLDLVALNIQRGRDHGIPKYNDARELYGLDRKNSFSQITTNFTVQKILSSLYDSVDDIDGFVGGLAEDHLEDSELGELFHIAVQDQFTRLRDGDRFFYEILKWPADLLNSEPVHELSHSSLTLQDIIVRNSGSTLRLDDFPENVFMMT